MRCNTLTPQNKNMTTSLSKRVLIPNKTITCGGVKKEELLDRVATEYRLALDAHNMMIRPEFTVTDARETVQLVFLSFDDLKFTRNAYTYEFMTEQFCTDWSSEYLNGQKIRLCLCGDGAQLRLQYPEQSKGERILIAMDPIDCGDDEPLVFNVGYVNSRRSLLGESAPPDRLWSLDWLIAFRLCDITV